MNARLWLLAIGSGLLATVACSSNDDTGGNAGSGGVAGGYYGQYGGMAGMAGGFAAGSGGIEAGTSGTGSSIAGTGGSIAGTGGSIAGTGGIEAGTGGIEAGTGGVEAGTGGVEAGTGGTDAATDNDAYVPPCLQDPSQVLFIGDSYVTMYPDTLLSPRVEALAQADGALAAGQTYRDVSVPGTSMGNGQIPSQFTDAAAIDPDIRLVIMTGGGNDVLIGAPQCEAAGSASNPSCQAVIQNGIDKARLLYDDMASVGVSDAIYFFYPHIPSGVLTGTAPNEILDYAYPLVEQECADVETTYNGALRCHFIDLRPIFGDTYQYINALDCIHPTAAGADLIAEEIYKVMKDKCLAQPESKGCCTP